jgi:hypothetical protein
LSQIHNDFLKLETKTIETFEKIGQNGHLQQHPSSSTYMPSNFYELPQDMPVEETSEQGGACTTFSLFGKEKNPPSEQHTWTRIPKLDMHQFEGFDIVR